MRDNGRDSERAKKEDKLKGLKCGLIAVAPALLLIIFILITKNTICAKLPVVLYKFLNSSYYSVIEVVVGKSATFGELAVLRMIPLFLIQLFVPLVSLTAYLLGYKNISIGEKFIYKKVKRNKR